MQSFHSRTEDCTIHNCGWVALNDSIEITKLPVFDAQTKLFARLGHGQAMAMLNGWNCRLPTADEYEKLHQLALFIPPFTMPTPSMLKSVGISIRDTASIDRYRNSNMMTRDWCAIHDGRVKELLEEAGWSDEPVSNAGKHWAVNGVIVGWWMKNGKKIQNPSMAHYHEPSYVDYGTTFHAVRRRDAVEQFPPTKSIQETGKVFTGVDVSKWQDPSKMDYARLAKDHRFLVARVTYGVKPDPTFREHFKRAKDAGMLVGGYHFFRQRQEPSAQLHYFLEELNSVGFGNGDILPVIDLEENEKWDGKLDPLLHNTSGQELLANVADEYGGCYAYLAPFYYVNIGEPRWLLDYPWWIAHYTRAKKPNCKWKEWDIWQYTGKGKTDGYAGKTIDINRALTVKLVSGMT